MSIRQSWMGLFRLMLVLGAGAIVPSLYAGTLVSVDFNAPNPYGFASPTFSGVEPAAAALDPLFAAANAWNGLNVPFLITGADVNPSWSGLVDSTGAATAIGFAVQGNVLGWSFYGSNPSYSDALRNDYFGFNSDDGTGRGISTTISWALTGLVPNAKYDMCFYGARADYQRGFNMTIGTSTEYIPTLLATDPQPSGCLAFRGVYANASGTISGTGTGIGSNVGVANEGDLAGFQIAEVSSSATPEPSSLVLVGSGILGLAGVIRRKLSL